jgi:ribosomal protein L11 methyltransferase
MKREAKPLWRIELQTSALAQPALAEALEENCEALSAFELTPGGDWRIEGLSRDRPDAAALRAQLALAASGLGLPAPSARIERLPDVDWLALNRRAFPPLGIGRYFVHGSHFAGQVPAGAIGIELDASIAFGSGEHATTRGCLLALGRLTRRRRGFRRALDLGCGSGILAIAAAKSWPLRVVAADNDAGSVRLAALNARENGVSGRRVKVLHSDGFSRLRRRRYDLVFANILARPLRWLSLPLACSVGRGGTLILSGLLSSQAADIVAAYRLQRLALRRRISIEDWQTLVMARRF